MGGSSMGPEASVIARDDCSQVGKLVSKLVASKTHISVEQLNAR